MSQNQGLKLKAYVLFAIGILFMCLIFTVLSATALSICRPETQPAPTSVWWPASKRPPNAASPLLLLWVRRKTAPKKCIRSFRNLQTGAVLTFSRTFRFALCAPLHPVWPIGHPPIHEDMGVYRFSGEVSPLSLSLSHSLSHA